MIVRIMSRGKSFSGLATYLTHDPKADTKERVAWTHTLNLANDHVPSAVDEMLWTSRNAELLKQEAGIRAGGRETENPVKHLSLNWAPDERPTREHMIETANGFLEHMNWREHQALIVAHSDRAHPHVHLMLNVVHPETGLRLDDNFERHRAQAWAASYEREQGRILLRTAAAYSGGARGCADAADVDGVQGKGTGIRASRKIPARKWICSSRILEKSGKFRSRRMAATERHPEAATGLPSWPTVNWHFRNYAAPFIRRYARIFARIGRLTMKPAKMAAIPPSSRS